jgi:hypothetical protein
MKKYFAVPLAVVFAAACSESTAPAKDADLAVNYAKPVTPSTTCSGCPLIATYDFEGGVVGSSGGTSVVTELQPGAAGTASDPNVVTAPSGEKFLGRFQNTQTTVVINIPAGYSTYRIDYDLYIIGSWDGRGKQAQSGVFQANVYEVDTRCGTTLTPRFKTTFSNQLTVQQDYPLPYLTGGNKAGTGSFDQDALLYKTAPAISNTPTFRSFGDTEYHMTQGGTNPCGGTAAFSVVISTSNPLQQSNYDESWGIDNVKIYGSA